MKLIIISMAVGFGGAIGAITRYLLAALFHATIGFPEYVAIMIVNILGCFLIGLVFFLLEGLLNKNNESRLKATILSKPLIDKGWWPNPDPTQPIVRDFKSDLKVELLAGFLITGILGGMTTFSLFSLISLNLQHNSQYIAMLINAVGTVIAGFIATYFGLYFGRLILIRMNPT